MKRTILSILLVSSPSLALADEVWNSPQYGEIIYENDVGTVGILSVQGNHPGSTAFLYVSGLGGNADHRGSHTGYWIENAPGDCTTFKTGVDGQSSNSWGELQVTFDNSSFPTGFSAKWGACEGDFSDSFRAELVQ